MRLIVMLLSFVVSAHVWAGELAKPTGKVILTMSGNIENTNESGNAVLYLLSDVASADNTECDTWDSHLLSEQKYPPGAPAG